MSSSPRLQSLDPPPVCGDPADDTGTPLATLGASGALSRVKVQAVTTPGSRFSMDDFDIDLAVQPVTCPTGRVAPFWGTARTHAYFGRTCVHCPLAEPCRSTMIQPADCVTFDAA
jgi:hypothetical protein